MLGVVLAGGASQRMGRDKAELQIGGEPLWQRQTRVLAAAGADPVVLVRQPQQKSFAGVACWHDRRLASGPLAGLHAALAPQSDAEVAVLAVDMPGIDPAWFIWLHRHCRPGCGAAARHPSGCEPLAAIYPAAALAAVTERLEKRELSVQALVQALAASGQMVLVEVPAENAGRARSVNTAAELAAWERSAQVRD